ncbi:MAG TPA: outer membrane lipoprotein-sorting protein [Ignavibacteria bacterium]|nr:outer membrane lipoprotein-sorting protein [Ignavibacteria bacterium]
MFVFIPFLLFGQNATQIVRKANNLQMGKTSISLSKMTIIRPGWSREITMKMWSKGNDYYMILITAPAREKGQVFLKRKNELWDWMPSIGRMIKIPPSMMMQSWMGSDFTNNDLLKESSIVVDYTHKIIGSEKVDGYNSYKIELRPKPHAAVVWNKIIMWISKKGYYELQIEYFDETGTLINRQLGSEIKKMGDRTLPTKLTMIPMDKKGDKTILKLINVVFNKPISNRFFSQQNMKRLR